VEAGQVRCLYNRPHMRTSTAVALLSCAVLIPAALAADSSLLGLAPADSDVLIGINFKQIRESNFGKLIVAQMAGPGNAAFKAFVDQAGGFDPLRDLDEALIAAPAKQNPNAFLMLRGHFDVAKLSQLAAAGGMMGADYHGVRIMARAGQQGGFSAVAVVDSSLIVGGDEAGVRAFVDRRGQGPSLRAAIAAKAGEVSQANDIWMVMHAAPAAFAPPGAAAGPMGDLVQSIEQVTLGVKFGTDIVISVQAVTHTPKDAEGLVAALRLFSGMAAAGQKDNQRVAALLQRLKLDSEGSTAKLWLTIPEAEAEAAVRDAMAAQMHAKAASPAPAPAPSEPASKDPDVVTLPAPKQ